jgi:hypothetical protein
LSRHFESLSTSTFWQNVTVKLDISCHCDTCYIRWVFSLLSFSWLVLPKDLHNKEWSHNLCSFVAVCDSTWPRSWWYTKELRWAWQSCFTYESLSFLFVSLQWIWWYKSLRKVHRRISVLQKHVAAIMYQLVSLQTSCKSGDTGYSSSWGILGNITWKFLILLFKRAAVNFGKHENSKLVIYDFPSLYILNSPQTKNSCTNRLYIQKFPDWPPGVRTANGTALCH